MEGNRRDLFEAVFCPTVLPRVTAESHEGRQLGQPFSETRIKMRPRSSSATHETATPLSSLRRNQMYKQIARKAATFVTEPLIQSDEASVKETNQRDPCAPSFLSSPKTAACSV